MSGNFGTACITELCFDSNLDLFLVLLAVVGKGQVDWKYVASIIEDPFLCYDWNTGRVFDLRIRHCRQFTITSDLLLAKWCVRVFPSVEAL